MALRVMLPRQPSMTPGEVLARSSSVCTLAVIADCPSGSAPPAQVTRSMPLKSGDASPASAAA
jgi:hypothetical protein